MLTCYIQLQIRSALCFICLPRRILCETVFILRKWLPRCTGTLRKWREPTVFTVSLLFISCCFQACFFLKAFSGMMCLRLCLLQHLLKSRRKMAGAKTSVFSYMCVLWHSTGHFSKKQTQILSVWQGLTVISADSNYRLTKRNLCSHLSLSAGWWEGNRFCVWDAGLLFACESGSLCRRCWCSALNIEGELSQK